MTSKAIYTNTMNTEGIKRVEIRSLEMKRSLKFHPQQTLYLRVHPAAEKPKPYCRPPFYAMTST